MKRMRVWLLVVVLELFLIYMIDPSVFLNAYRLISHLLKL